MSPLPAAALAALVATAVLLARDPADVHLWVGLALGVLLGAGLIPLRRLSPRSRRANARAAPTPVPTGDSGPLAQEASPVEGPAAEASRDRGRPSREPARALPPPPAVGGGALVLASVALADELVSAVEGWGGHADRVESTVRLLARLITAVEQGVPYRTLLVERARLQVRPAELLAAVREEPSLGGLRAVLIDQGAARAEEASLWCAGYTAVLGLPLDKTLLFNALHGPVGEGGRPDNAVSLASYYRQRLQARKARVLLADDSPISRNALKGILERADYVVHVARDGEEALDALERGRPSVDVVVLDVRMPGRSGLDVLRAYRFMHPEAAVPVVMLTAETSPEVREACLRGGASAFLQKPVDPQALLSVLAGLRTRRATGAPTPGSGSGRPAVARIDEATLESLRRLGREPGFLATLIDGFIREGKQVLARIERALAEGDQCAMLDALQALRGASGEVGAREVATLCERLQEVPGERLRSPRAALLVEALARAFEASAVALTDYLERVEDAAQ